MGNFGVLAQLLVKKRVWEVEIAQIILDHIFPQVVAHSHDLVSIFKGVVSREENVLLIAHSVLQERTAWCLHFILVLNQSVFLKVLFKSQILMSLINLERQINSIANVDQIILHLIKALIWHHLVLFLNLKTQYPLYLLLVVKLLVKEHVVVLVGQGLALV